VNESFSLINTTKKNIPRLPVGLFYRELMPKKYKLSIVYVGKAKSQELNRKYRKIERPTNILSFPLSSDEGEIIICLPKAIEEAKNTGNAIREYVGFLILHGILHLKGFKHGSTMEKMEDKLMKKYFNKTKIKI